METPPETNSNLADATKRIARRLLTVCDNRIELLMVEIQEERERALLAVFLASGAAVLGLLAGIALTAAIAVAAGKHFLAALVALAFLYIVVAGFFCLKLARLRRKGEALSGTRDQLRKDRECLEKRLA